MSNLIICPSPEVLQNLFITGDFREVHEWQNNTRAFSEAQQLVDGVPLWEGDALLKVGYQNAMEIVKVRVSSMTNPVVQMNLSKLASADISLAEPQRG